MISPQDIADYRLKSYATPEQAAASLRAEILNNAQYGDGSRLSTLVLALDIVLQTQTQEVHNA
jgi:hypothetical protein